MFALLQVDGMLTTVSNLHIGEGTDYSMTTDVSTPTRKVAGMPIIPATSFKGILRKIAVATEVSEPCIERLFGSTDKRGQIIFEDLKIVDKKNKNMLEVKYENTIDRETGISNPRNIETVSKGNEFTISMKYQVVSVDTVEEDMKTMVDLMKLLKFESVGANATRGYGKVECSQFNVEVLVGDNDGELDDVLETINEYAVAE